MVAVYVIVLALVYIGLLLVMSVAAVNILNDDIIFTDDGTFSFDRGSLKRVMVKSMIFLAGMCAYIYMLWNFKFID